MSDKVTWRVYSNIKDCSEIQSIVDLRIQVFANEQGFPLNLQTDDNDFVATHIEMLFNDKPVGAARIFAKDDKLIMGRFLILKEFRHLGLGRKLMDKIVEEAKKTDFDELTIYSQHQVVHFYEKCGAIVTGETFILADYPHVPMVYRLK